MKADGLKSAITYFNKYLTADKSGRYIKLETFDVAGTKNLFLSTFKNEIGLRYRIPIEEDISILGAVDYQALSDAMKPIKKKDEVCLEIVEKNLFINGASIPLTRTNPMSYMWEENAKIPMEYWESIIPINKDCYQKSMYEVLNHLYFQISSDGLEVVNTNEAVLIYGKAKATCLKDVCFGIPHSSLSWLSKFSFISKNDEIQLMTIEKAVSIFDGAAEMIIPKVDGSKYFSKLKELSKKEFDSIAYPISDISKEDTAKIKIKEFKSDKGGFLPYVDLDTEALGVRVQTKFLAPVLEYTDFTVEFPTNELTPIVFRENLDDTKVVYMLFPIDKSKQLV